MKKIICNTLATAIALGSVPVYALAKPVQEMQVITSSYSNEDDTEIVSPKEIKTIAINIGRTKSELNFTWLSNYEESYLYINNQKIIPEKSEELSSNEGFYKYTALVDTSEFSSIFYEIGNDDYKTDAKNINLSNADDNKYSFLLAGDPQIGSSGVESDKQGFNTTLEKSETWFGSDIDFLLTVGDQVEASRTGYAEEEYEAFLSSEYISKMPLAVNVGNHEVYTYSSYSDHFTAPKTMDENTVTQTTQTLSGSQTGDYWYEYEGTLFISLNTNHSSNSNHIAFLKKAVQEYKAQYGEPKWQIVTFHQSIYSSATHSANATLMTLREDLVDTFSQLNIDAVLMGHDHVHTRSVMMNGLIPTTTTDNNINHTPLSYTTDPKAGDVLYLTVNSSSGSKHYDILDVQYDYIAFKNQESVPNITKVDVSDNALVFTTYRTGEKNEKTDIVDTFSIVRTSNYTSNEKLKEEINSNDVSAPKISYKSNVTVYTDEEFNIFDSVSATDTTFDEDGNYITQDITDKIIVIGNVDNKIAGEYNVSFFVSDDAGNTSTVDVLFSVRERKSFAQTGSEFFVYSGEELENWNTDLEISENWYIETSPFDETTFENDATFLVTSFETPNIDIVESIEGTVDNNKNSTIYINGNKVDYITNRGVATNNFAITNVADYLTEGRNVLAIKHENTDDFEFDLISFKVIMSETIIEENQTNNNSTSSSNSQSNNADTEEFEELEVEFEEKNDNVNQNSFTDVLSTDWYFDAVNYAIENGLFTGVTENSFAPNANMSRAMLWTVLYRNAGETGVTTGANWYVEAQKWANEQGISDGTNPNGDMTREELATMLYRSAGEPEVTTNDISTYADGQNVSNWAENAMNWAVEQGIITGKGDNNLAPTDTASRAEVATMLMRFLG